MNAEVKSAWIEALRSGTYIQGKQTLIAKDPNGGKEHCCLGVLCEIAIAQEITSAPKWTTTFSNFELAGKEVAAFSDDVDKIEYISTDSEYLPDDVRDWAGLRDSDPTVVLSGENGKSVCKSLSELNDDGYSFETIAAYIEEQL